MNKKIFVKTLGCKVNFYETNSILSSFLNNGFEYSSKNPDIIVLNSCSVTSIADRKSRQFLSTLKKKHPEAVLIVCGCHFQSLDSETLQNINADIILGNIDKNLIYDYWKEFETNHKKIIKVGDFKNKHNKYQYFKYFGSFDKNRAYLKIQDGCNKFCSFCLIPYIRLNSRSRKKEDIFEEIEYLLKNDFKEIVITGIDVSSYGLDLYNNYNISNLLEDILIKFKCDFRLRLSSIEESMIDEKFINLFHDKRLARHLHLSLQSGSDHVLKRMNRRYSTNQFYEKINLIKTKFPNINFTTDVIVGFPGETSEDFVNTINFVTKCGFSKIHVFPYSDRKGTPASKMDLHVDSKTKKERVKQLIEVSSYLEKKYIEKFINTKDEFLIEKYDEKQQSFFGHSSNYLQCILPKLKYGNLLINNTYKILITFDNVKID